MEQEPAAGTRMPDGSSKGKRWLPLALLALAAALHALAFGDCGPLDDDFICYRYAENLLSGEGLVYNPGERVEGYTAPLWVLLLAAAMALGAAPVQASLAIGALASAAAAWAIGAWWLGRRPAQRWPLPALLLALAPATAYHAAAGLGTTLLGACLAVWLWRYDAAWRAGRPALGAALALGAAGLVRPEAMLFAPLFLLEERRRGHLGTALLALVPCAAWLVLRVAYYGRLLPVPYLVKKLPFAADLAYGLAYLGRATLECGAGLTLALGAWLVLCRWRALGAATRAAAAGLVAHGAYVVLVGGDYMPLARFFVPVLPLALGLACLAARELLAGRARALRLVGGLACLVSVIPERARPELRALHEQHEARWSAIGRTLAATTPPATRVAVSAIGAIGYHSRRPIVDMLGVTNAHILEVEPDLRIEMKGHQRHDAGWVLAQRPDLVLPGNGILLPGTTTVPGYLWEEDLLRHPELARLYTPMLLAVEGSYDLVLLVRSGSAPPLGARPYARGG